MASKPEVLPHAADTWYGKTALRPASTKPQPLRTLAEIRADVLALQQETGGLLDEIVGAPSKARL